MIEVGKSYYVIVHSYYHCLVTVASIQSKREFTTSHCVLVHSCSRSWTEFFRDGCKNDTQFDVLPKGTCIDGWILPPIPWKHSIPEKE